MKKKYSAIAIGAIFLISCNNNAPKTSNTEQVVVEIGTRQCYASTLNKDSALLVLNFKGNIVEGSMDYKINGKDKNKGSLNGEMKGDTIFADYKFLSEGVESVRQVAFLKMDSTLTEGYGDVEEKNGKTVFKNAAALDFSKGLKMQKVDCAK